MAQVKWSNAAKMDLKQIFEYIARDSRQYGDKVIKDIIEKSENLLNFPRMGRSVPEMLDDNIREIIIYSYRLVYELVSDEEVQVIALIHSKRQIPIET